MSNYYADRREQYLERPLPSNEDAERVTLGAILLSQLLAAEVFSILDPEDFYSPLHRRVATAMQALYQAGQKIDPILIAEELKKTGAIDSLGGTTAITNLTYGLPHFSAVGEYVNIVKEKALARQIIRFNNDITSEILAEERDVHQIIAEASAQLIRLQEFQTMRTTASMAQVAKEVRQLFAEWRRGDLSGSSLRTGLPEVDERLRLRGIAKGEMTLIGARPSTGKTALLLQIAAHIIRTGAPLLFISLEMLRTRLVMRLLPASTNIANKAINPLTFKNLPAQAEKLEGALNAIEHLPVYFDRSFDIHKIIAVIEYFVTAKKIQGFVFDYLTLIRRENAPRGSRHDLDIGYIIDELKECAIRNKIAALGAAQLSRDIEKEHRDARMSDMRDSGIIEQSADVLLFLTDPKAKEHADNPDLIKNQMYLDLFCAKQRDGERWWRTKLDYNKNLQTFTTVTMDSYSPPPIRNFYEKEEED